MAKKSSSQKRANKYNERVKVKGSFDDLMDALFPKSEPPKKKVSKASKKKSPKKK